MTPLLIAALVTTTAADVEVDGRGYALLRTQLYAPDEGAVLHPFLEVEPVRLLGELNLELSVSGDSLYFYSDTAALIRAIPEGCTPEDDLRSCLVLNEVYAEWMPAEWARLLVGRKRLSWGTGIGVQPVEHLNALPDLTDPASQRLGAWIAMGELYLGRFTTTLLVAPEISHSPLGLPDQLDPLFGHLGARVAFGGDGYDLAAIGYLDYGEGKALGGGTASASIPLALPFGLVVHGQLLVHERREIQTGTFEEGSCPGFADIGIPHRRELDATALVGARADLDDGTLISAEYLHNADGMVAADYRTTLTTVNVLKNQCPGGRITPQAVAQQGRPVQFSNVLLGRNYVYLSVLRPSLLELGPLEDTSLFATAIVGVDDLNAALFIRLSHTLQNTVVTRLGVFLPVGPEGGQFDILPFDAFGVAELQVSF